MLKNTQIPSFYQIVPADTRAKVTFLIVFDQPFFKKWFFWSKSDNLGPLSSTISCFYFFIFCETALTNGLGSWKTLKFSNLKQLYQSSFNKMKKKLKCVWEIWLLDFVLPGFAKTLKTPENVAKKSQQFDWKTYVFIIFRASRKTLKTRNSRNSLHKRLCVWKNQIVEIIKRVSALVIPSRLYV